jgi:hypothetical protein
MRTPTDSAQLVRLAALFIIFTFVSASGNPRIPDPLDFYISFERLAVTIGTDAAEFTGTFKFETVGQKSYPTQTVGLELPIWFPVNTQDDPQMARFWSIFDQPYHTSFSSEEKQMLDEMLHLKVELAGKELPLALLTISGRGDTSRFIPKNWEVLGCRVLLFSFAVTPEVIGNGNQVTISHRQPLLRKNGERYFLYTPIFDHLPKSTSTANTDLYAVTLTAGPGCDVTVKTGAFTSHLNEGQTVTLSPQHLQFIRGTVRIPYLRAIEIASRLAVGMQQSEVRKVLEQKGFGKPDSSGVMHHLCFFEQDRLAEGYALELEYKPPTTSPTNDISLWVATSRLQGASIRSNGVHVVSITLSNSP